MDHRLVQAIEKAFDWDSSRLLGRGFALGTMADVNLCAKLLTPARLLDLIMRRSVAPPQFRCFQGGEELHPGAYVANVVTRRGQSLPMARMDELGRLMMAGCTIVLDTLDSFDPALEVACQALQWWSRELVQANTYLTTGDAAGFNLHWDDHDVIIVQLSGAKSWEVRGPSRMAPMFRDAHVNNEPADTIEWAGTLRAGDVIHIPRGYWHRATRADHGAGHSLHATFGFVQRTGVDWLTWVADRSRESETFRRDLDRSGRPDDRLAAMVPELMTRYPQASYLAARERERPPRRHVRTAGVFGPATDVVCVTDFPPYIESAGSTVTVLAGGKELVFKAKAEQALRLLLSGNPANITQVSRTTGVNADVLAETLLDVGVCAELTTELAGGYLGLCSHAT
jgi:hypothetical protein